MSDTSISKRILVAGDVTLDWQIAHIPGGDESSFQWTADQQTRVSCHRGGAALLADLIESVNDRLSQQAGTRHEILQSSAPLADISKTDRSFHHSYAMWSLFDPDQNPGKTSGHVGKVWRVKEFLGLDLNEKQSGSAVSNNQELTGDGSDCSIVVIDDTNLGFRSSSDNWPAVIKNQNGAPWIVLKDVKPVAQGELWNYLTKHYADRLIVVMNAMDLRRSDVQISRQLSWERTAQDVVWELTHNPQINGLSRCAHTIVSFGADGAILLSRDETGVLQGKLFFEPEILEGSWVKPDQGNVIGNNTTLTAAIVRQLMLHPEAPDLGQGIQSGVAGMRKLFQEGYGTYSDNREAELAFPFESVVLELETTQSLLVVAEIQNPVLTLPQTGAQVRTTSRRRWTILEDQYSGNLDQVAEQIVLKGLKSALKGVPIGKIGGLTTVDRTEFEALRSIQNLMGEYCSQSQKKPLSLAVFGPPGSGKSFGVEQVAKSIRPGQIEVLTFNISQFDDPHDLHGALHQVRDVGLRGKLPLVFWDEFDSTLDGKPLGWLRYFLAPMQDGSFQDGQITHPVGRCIFVFAGGTSEQMSQFETQLDSDDSERKSVKLPDFTSRLKGFLNVMGPNQQGQTSGDDPYFKIRRAILLRSIFERNSPLLFNEFQGSKSLNIDPGVLRAFIQTRKFKHGIRSIESIVTMSNLSHQKKYARSSLPAEAQLDLHVEGREFLALVQQIDLNGELLETLSEAAHEVFREGKERDGWVYGSTRNDAEKIHPLLIPYAELPEQFKEANRVSVRSIPRKLALAGYVMLPARSNEPALQFPGADLEQLAELEHEIWMEAKLADGFELGEETPENPRRNPYLVPWRDVPDSIRESDRDLVKDIPRILSRAGYAVVKLNAVG
ncbi:RyR domain-containing protein [Gimesia algae]|uniref:RyR domain protein n=1 Tax=Gimesia algae TaxID=2527971 RepID=A0A517VAB4_9PLAN|nr:RyR domain-containing protein [Gimesia algae]QDT89935.1 RyR domain protein [Gimesia algae]